MPWGKRIWPVWARTVGGMIARGAAVRVHCRQCGTFFDVDLVAIRKARGDAHSLINASTGCRITSCRGRAYFLAAASMTERFLLLVTSDMVQRSRLGHLPPIAIAAPAA